MKIALLFAGQGAQHVGMGTDFYEECPAYRNAVDAVLDGDKRIKIIMDEGPEELLKRTDITQPSMAIFAIGVKAILDEMGIKADATCGLSIGEYGALYAAGVITAKEYLDLVTYRGKVMAEASEQVDFAMSAIVGLDSITVEKIVADSQDAGYVCVANYNCPGQYVICGDETAVVACEAKCIDANARQTIRLKVGGPFHTKYMCDAGAKLRDKLNAVDFKKPNIPILMNLSGDYLGDEPIAEVMEKQISNGVHFEDQINRLLEDGYDTFIEIGPGKTLTGFVKKAAKKVGLKVNCHFIDSAEDLQKIKCE